MTTRILWIATGLGDSALLVPAAVLLAAYLWLLGSKRTAASWVSALLLCAALTVLAKIAFAACAAHVPGLHIHSPSGHTSMSVTFYGCSALILATEAAPPARSLVLVSGVLLVFLIAVSRVLLHAHSPSEVAAGFSIGVVSVAWFAGRWFGGPAKPVPWLPILLGMAVLAVALHGWHWRFEDLFHALAREVRLDLDVCR